VTHPGPGAGGQLAGSAPGGPRSVWKGQAGMELGTWGTCPAFVSAQNLKPGFSFLHR
jgi:hypothetical protein